MPNLTIGVVRKTDRPRHSHSLEARSDVDHIPHEVAIALLNDVAHVNADTEFDAPFGRQSDVTLNHAGLHLDRAANRIDDAPELNDAAVPSALDDTPAMGGDGGVDQIATKTAQTRKGPVLVGASKPAVAHDIRDQHRRELPAFAHRVPLTEAH